VGPGATAAVTDQPLHPRLAFTQGVPEDRARGEAAGDYAAVGVRFGSPHCWGGPRGRAAGPAASSSGRVERDCVRDALRLLGRAGLDAALLQRLLLCHPGGVLPGGFASATRGRGQLVTPASQYQAHVISVGNAARSGATRWSRSRLDLHARSTSLALRRRSAADHPRGRGGAAGASPADERCRVPCGRPVKRLRGICCRRRAVTQQYNDVVGIEFADDAERARRPEPSPTCLGQSSGNGAPGRANPAGATGLEPATPGFGDRCATNCATPLGCGAQCTPTLLVTLCHEPCSGTRSQPCSPPSRSRSRSSRSGRRSREGARGSSRWLRRRSPSGWGTSLGGSGQADRAIWPSRWDESGGRRRILLGW
jgi:hypothetical protein